MFERLGRLIRSFVNSILGRAERRMTIPEMEQALREMRVKLYKFKETVATAMAHEKRAKRRLDAERARYKRLTEQARLAAEQSLTAPPSKRAHFEKLAKRALQLRGECDKNIAALKSAWTQAKRAAESAKANFERAAEEVEKRARALKEAQIISELTKARRELQGLDETLDIDSAARAFDEGLERIHTEAEKLEALDRLVLSEGEELDRELAKITSKTEVDRQFEDLLSELKGEQPKVEEPTRRTERDEEREIDSALDAG
jgi:phage shock protein A